MYLTGIPLPTLLAFLLLGSLLSLPFLGVTAKIVTFHVERHHRDLEHRKIYAVSLSVITVGFWLFLFVTQREVFPYMAISVAISYFTLIGEAFLIAPHGAPAHHGKHRVAKDHHSTKNHTTR